MSFNYPESSFLKQPHKIEGVNKQSKESFYELAKSRVRFLSRDDFYKQAVTFSGDPAIKDYVAVAFGAWNYVDKFSDDENFERFVTNLEIFVDKDAFTEEEKELMPFLVEHEICEAWLSFKKGFHDQAKKEFENDQFELMSQNHELALRKEFVEAERVGLADKLYEWRINKMPRSEQDCKMALNNAKKKIK